MKPSPKLRHISLLAGSLCATVNIAAAQTFAEYRFTGGSAASTDTEALTTASDITFGTGIVGAVFSNTNNRLEIGGDDTQFSNSSQTLPDQLTNALNNNMYFKYTVTIPSNVTVDFTSLASTYSWSSSYRFGMGVFTDKTGFSTHSQSLDSLYVDGSTSSSNRNINLSTNTSFQNLTNTSLEFRFYISDGSSSNTREHRFDDILLSGDLHQSGTWAVDANGTWTTASNWSGSNRAYGKDKTAYFTGDLTDNRTITLGSNRRIGNISFTDANSSHDLTISGANTLTLEVSSGAPVIDVTQAGRTLTIDSVLAGSNGLTKQGAGTLSLSGANTYTGDTIINAGTLAIGNTATNLIAKSSKIAIAGGATFSVSSANSNNFTLASGQSIEGFGSGIATFNTGSATTNGVITTANTTISHGGTGTLKFQRLEIRGSGNEMTGGNVESGVAGSRRGLVVGNNTTGTFTISGGTFTSLGGSSASDLLGVNSASGTLYLSGGNYSTDTLSIGLGGTTSPGGTLDISSGSATINTLIFNANSSGGQGIVNLSGGTLTLGTLTSTAGATRQFNFNGGQFVASGNVEFDNTLTLNVQNGGAKIDTNGNSVLVSGNLVNNGSGTLTKSGAGTLTLSGNNTFSGGISSSGTGALALQHSNAAGTGTISLASTVTNTNTALQVSGGINVANSIIIDATTGRHNIYSSSGSNALSGNITINGTSSNTIVFHNAATSGSNTTFTVGGATPNITTISASTYANLISFRASNAGELGILNSRITAPNATVNTNNSGIWTINSSGSSWAVTSISNASSGFKLGANDALATGARVDMNSGGSIDLNGKNQTVAGLGGTSNLGQIVNNSSSNDSVLTLAGLTADQVYSSAIKDGSSKKVSLVMNSSGRTQTLSGINTYTGATTISGGTLQLGNGGTTGSLSASSDITNNATLAFNRSNTLTQGTDFGTITSGTGAVVQNGSGTVVLNTANTYSGGTTVNAGTLSLTTSATAAGSGGITVSGGSAILKIDSAITLENNITVTNATASVQRTVSANGGAYNLGTSSNTSTLGNLKSSFTGGTPDTTAKILDGTNSSASETILNMSFSASSGADNDSTRRSDVFKLSGTGTDAYVIQILVDAGLASDSRIGWLDTFTNSWVNVGSNLISGAYNNVLTVGNYGFDPDAGGTGIGGVWAVVNYGGSFAAIPEPTTALAGLLLTAGLLRRRRHGGNGQGSRRA